MREVDNLGEREGESIWRNNRTKEAQRERDRERETEREREDWQYVE